MKVENESGLFREIRHGGSGIARRRTKKAARMVDPGCSRW